MSFNTFLAKIESTTTVSVIAQLIKNEKLNMNRIKYFSFN